MAPTGTARRPIRILPRAAALAAFALAVLLPAAAGGRESAAHVSAVHASCPATKPSPHRARHAAKRAACTKRHARKHATHKSKKPSTRKSSAPPVELVPAACEDGRPPSHAGAGSYSCEDGSAPACQEGTPSRVATGAPMCAITKGSGGEARCSTEGTGECEAEFVCEGTGTGEASRMCEHAGEAEAPEPEEE